MKMYYNFITTLSLFAYTMFYSQVALASEISTIALTDADVWLGVAVPHWVGWVFYLLALSFGATLSVHQETDVDKYIKYPKAKPYYSFGFALFFTLFAVPLKFPDVTIWTLIVPAVITAAIGSQIIYYIISSGLLIINFMLNKFFNIDLDEFKKRKRSNSNTNIEKEFS